MAKPSAVDKAFCWPRAGRMVLFFWLALFPFFSTRAGAGTEGSQGRVLGTEGAVDFARGQAEWTQAMTGQQLAVADRLRTQRDSRAMLELAELGRMRLDQLTTLEVMAPTSAGSDATLDLKAGALYFFTRGRPRQFDIQTPYAMAASRGTEFLVTIEAGGAATFAVFDGVVELTNGLGGVALRSGEIGTARAGQAPMRTAVIGTTNIVQWWLYYPGALDTAELRLTEVERARLGTSLAAYNAGDLLGALKAYQAGTTAASEDERIYHAAVLLAAGQVAEAESELRGLGDAARLAHGLREVIAATCLRTAGATNAAPETATEWLARSYTQQAHYDLAGALRSALAAVAKDEKFGLAWERMAELQFSFGKIEEALKALDASLALAPRNAQAWALKGFLAAARNQMAEAARDFEKAKELDSALGNAWLGLGLVRMHQNQAVAGRKDLQTAAAMEPNRSELRSYLGKAFDAVGDDKHTSEELALAKRLDPADPTPWLYAALYLRQELRYNEAIGDLEHSMELNDNRRVYRSQLLLDQDRAVRGSSLATIYRDDGMDEVSVREAARAVADDYGNASAHQFLAESFDALRDPTRFNLRYETPWFNELLLANILSPVGAGNLSANISQEEYSRMFEGNGLNFSDDTQYRSDGQVHELASQFGREGNMAYALDLDYQHNDGVRPNNALDRIEWYTTVKEQLTPQDSLLVLTKYLDYHSGDNFQRYDQSVVRTNYQLNETQTPLLAVAYHHEWQPGVHTLILGSRLADDESFSDTGVSQLIVTTNRGGGVGNVQELGIDPKTGLPDGGMNVGYSSQLQIYSLEINQITQGDWNTAVLGFRTQHGWFSTHDVLTNVQPAADAYLFGSPAASDAARSDFNRETAYVYDTVEPVNHLLLTLGVDYEYMLYPDNFRISPISDAESERQRVEPKAALVWSPRPEVTLRAAYARSLGGASFDESFQLEPTQLAGFVQSYRSIISESLVGEVSASDYQLAGGALDLAFKGHTYVTLEGQLLSSKVNRGYGMFAYNGAATPASIGAYNTTELLNYSEPSITATLNQLVGEGLSVGAQYKFTHSFLQTRFPDIPDEANSTLQSDNAANLQVLTLFAAFNHPSGFFAQVEAQWYHQDNFGYTPAEAPEDMWQDNVLVGWRMKRQRAEVAVGGLNLLGHDYNLNPLNPYVELPRGRVFTAQLKVNL